MKQKNPKQIRILSFFLIIESLILIGLLTLSYFLYMDHVNTKIVIDDITDLILLYFMNFMLWLNEVYKYTEFNNREIAIGIGLLLFVAFALSVKNVRGLIPNLIRSALDRKLIYWYISMILYFIGLIYILNQIGFWEVRLLKDSVIWYLTVAFVATFRSTTKARDLGFFYLFLKDNIKIIVVFEFIMNMYTFSVLIEFILVFAITFFSILISFIHSSPKYQDKNSKI